MSGATLKTQFSDNVKTALGCVTERYVFIDTIKVLTNRRPDMRPDHYDPRKFLIKRTKMMRWPWSIRVQRPSNEDIEDLMRKCPTHLIGRLDLALDYVRS